MAGVLREFWKPAGCIKRVVDIGNILEIRVIFIDFGGTILYACSQFIAPMHQQMGLGHMSHHMSIREVADMSQPVDRGC